MVSLKSPPTINPIEPSRVRELWRKLVVENPMTIEITRFRRHFLEGGRGKSVNSMILVVAIIAYAGLLLVIANVSGDFPPVGLIFIQTGVFALLAPAIAYSSIAGERERRSWDLLLAAPITHAQIVMGKFLACLAGLATAFGLFLVPTLFTALTYRGISSGSYYDYVSPQAQGALPGWRALIEQELVSITFGMAVIAFTLFFSARCRRSLMALGVTLTSLFLGLLAIPSLLMAVGENDGRDLLLTFHPMFAINRIEEYQQSWTARSFDPLGPSWYGVPQILLNLGITAMFLFWAHKTVNFADGDKKFIPVKPSA
ncbi:MAG: hypothetical protein QOJ65_926 [Fimbriimonadaceae bacterium]|jgi:ABC-type transport system involved in multi-copper enzyme maturation permease subunit|nr:hypothetical protein [Fimbriimonadaceae bacterium]